MSATTEVTVESTYAVGPVVERTQSSWWATTRRAMGYGRTKVGLVILALLCLVALFGPFVAPYSPTEFVAPPLTGPSEQALLGTDQLGRDVVTRFLYGGRTVIALALAAAIIGVGAGIAIGLVAAYFKGLTDELLMRANDVLLCFPQVVLVLLLVAGVGTKLWVLVLTVAAGHAPRTARVIRGVGLEVAERDFVKAAEVRGESRFRILFKELLPNVSSPAMVELGLRFTYSIGLIAGVSFLGFGLQPPAADWGLMINENRLALAIQPWGVVLPVTAIALLTIGANFVTDGFARAALGTED